MDNRTDVTEDVQSTPEHSVGQGAIDGRPGAQQAGQKENAPPLEASSGLTAGPHNEPPPGPGVEGKYHAVAQQSQAAPSSDKLTSEKAGESQTLQERASSGLKSFQQSLGRNPLPWIVSAAGLTLLMLAFRKAKGR